MTQNLDVVTDALILAGVGAEPEVFDRGHVLDDSQGEEKPILSGGRKVEGILKNKE